MIYLQVEFSRAPWIASIASYVHIHTKVHMLVVNCNTTLTYWKNFPNSPDKGVHKFTMLIYAVSPRTGKIRQIECVVNALVIQEVTQTTSSDNGCTDDDITKNSKMMSVYAMLEFDLNNQTLFVESISLFQD